VDTIRGRKCQPVPLMTTVQIADLLGVSERRVKELIKNGDLQTQTVGGVWEVDRRQLASLAKRLGPKPHNHKAED
jgi:excisionase family DNA binding protein